MAGILNRAAASVLVLSLGLVMAGPAWAANAQAGNGVFKSNCAICHGDKPNSPSTVGPRLYGIVGRKAGALPGFNFSAAMKNSGLTWTPSELQAYISDPAKVVHGTRMPFAGLHDTGKVDDLIAYLETLK